VVVLKEAGVNLLRIDTSCFIPPNFMEWSLIRLCTSQPASTSRRVRLTLFQGYIQKQVIADIPFVPSAMIMWIFHRFLLKQMPLLKVAPLVTFKINIRPSPRTSVQVSLLLLVGMHGFGSFYTIVVEIKGNDRLRLCTWFDDKVPC
jgi:hypothetical protein